MPQQPAQVSARQAPPDASLLIERALDCMVAGRMHEAQAICRRILANDSRHFESLHVLGILNIRRGRFAEAVAQIDLALSVNPDVADAHNNRGNALKELKRFDEALASYDRAIALSPQFAEAFYNRGKALLELKRLDEALVSYDRA